MCKRTWDREVLDREKCYTKYKNMPTNQNKINYKRARAVATYTFRLAKAEDMKKFLNTMKINAPMSMKNFGKYEEELLTLVVV